MNLPSKETGVKATGDAKHFSPDSANRVVWQSNQHQEASFEYQFLKRELCFLARALSETRQLGNQRARDYSAIEVTGSLKDERRPATQEAGAAFRRAPSPPLEDPAFQVCARVEGGEFAGEPPPGSF